MELTDLQPNTMYTAYLFNTLSVSFTTLSGEKIYREYPPCKHMFGIISVIRERKEKGEGFNRDLNPIIWQHNVHSVMFYNSVILQSSWINGISSLPVQDFLKNQIILLGHIK